MNEKNTKWQNVNSQPVKLQNSWMPNAVENVYLNAAQSITPRLKAPTGKGGTIVGAVAKEVPGIVPSWKPIATKEESDGGDNTKDSGNTDGSTSGSVVLGGAQGEAVSGAMSYEDYLKNYGADTTKNYLASVKQANDDYYRSLMTYGMNAEALASGGMTGAGVSSYGNDAAWAARQGAVSYAGAVKQAGDTENAKNYFDYVQTYNANQEKATAEKNKARSDMVNSLITSGITDAATIKLMLGQTGNFTSEEIETIGNQIASGATSVVAEADVTAAEQLFASSIGSLGLAATKLALSQKYGDDVANQVIGEQTAIVKTAIADLVRQYDPAKTDQDAIAELKAYQKQGYLTPEEAEGHIATIQQANKDHFEGLLRDARDEYKVGNVLKALGGDAATIEGEAGSVESKAIKLARDAVVAAYNKGDISLDAAVDMMCGEFFEEIDAVVGTKQQGEWLQFICGDMIVWEEYSRKMGNDTLYRELMQALVSKIDIAEEKDAVSDEYIYYLYYDGKNIGCVDHFKYDENNIQPLPYYHNKEERALPSEQALMLTNIYEAFKARKQTQDVGGKAN